MSVKTIVFIAAVLTMLWVSVTAKQEARSLQRQLDSLENQFQIYRAAAEDAYGWAIGSDSEYGEKIPGEFFWRYSDDV